MSKGHQQKRVYWDSEPAFYEHLESLLEVGLCELEENDQCYRVTSAHGENWVGLRFEPDLAYYAIDVANASSRGQLTANPS